MKIDEGHQFATLKHSQPFRGNPALQRLLQRVLQDSPHRSTIFANLDSLADRCVNEHSVSANKLQGVEDEPRLIQYNAWGQRVDELRTGEGWRELKAASAREGIAAEGYGSNVFEDDSRPRGYLGRDTLGEHARVYAFAKILLFGPVSKVVLCPVSMTDGAVRVLELVGTPSQRRLIPLLTHPDPRKAWTAGQWMTERPGGSDVSNTETVARAVNPRSDGKYVPGDAFLLDGFKWFSSATDGDIAMALARTDDDVSKGSGGLSLFLIRIRDAETGQLNGIRMHRLKKKLGTRYLPTAELELSGCKAELVGPLGAGIKTISSVLNITRLYSASGGVLGLYTGLQRAAHFAANRNVFGHPLRDWPLHTDTLFKLHVLAQGLAQVFFRTTSLLGKTEAGTASSDEALLLRLYTPALKAFTAVRATQGMLGMLDAFGGQGYMEDSGLGVAEVLRDLSVERIWEGTVEVLSMDVVRVVGQTRGRALQVLVEDLRRRSEGVGTDDRAGLDEAIDRLESASYAVLERLASGAASLGNGAAMDARFALPLLELIMVTSAHALLLEQAAWSSVHCDRSVAQEDIAVARRWAGEVGDSVAIFNRLQHSLDSSKGDVDVMYRSVYGSVGGGVGGGVNGDVDGHGRSLSKL